jgi:hypothetical protein
MPTPRIEKKILIYALKKLDKPVSIILHSEVLAFIKHISIYAAMSSFLATIVFVYLRDNNFIFWHAIPENYYASIYAAFTFILFYEIISMVFALPYSIANSVSKQYEVISLVIVRHIFEYTGDFTHIHSLNEDYMEFGYLAVSIFGSLSIFFLIGVFHKVQLHTEMETTRENLLIFVFLKKILALFLFAVIIWLAFLELTHFIDFLLFGHSGGYVPEIGQFGHQFYKTVFSVMIFVDILLVLITMQYGGSYQLVFRNTGLLISTVLLRVSFGAEMITSIVLVTTAIIIAILSSLIYNMYFKIKNDLEERHKRLYDISSLTGPVVSVIKPTTESLLIQNESGN